MGEKPEYLTKTKKKDVKKYIPSGLYVSIRTMVLLIFAAGAVGLTVQINNLDLEDQAVYSLYIVDVVYVFCTASALSGALVTSLWCDLAWDND